MHVFLFLLTFLFTQPASAFKIKLIDSTLELDRGINSTTATVVNDSENMIAIEATARVRQYNEDGSENIDTIADDLIIVPGQMIIPPNGEQVLNIRWTGPKTVESEKAYRLLIEYVSIDESKLKGIDPSGQKAGVVINYRIGKSFYVKPKNTNPSVSLTQVQKFTQEGVQGLKMSFENIGTEHKVAHALNVEFTTASEEKISVTFGSEVLGNSINILAKSKRIVTTPVPEALKGREIVSAVLVGFDPVVVEPVLEE